MHIAVDGEDITALPPHRRPVNMMFQSYALFPHMSVAANIGYGLKGRPGAQERVAALLKLVRLEGFGDRKPETLSGGQRQRVALARAIAREPSLLLLDEPLGALDRGLREETQGELRSLQRRLGTSFVVVTHDPEEAMMLADRIGVMERGRLVQVGSPADLYRRPASRYVAGLLGDVNLIPGSPRKGGAEGGCEVVTPHGTVTARPGSESLAEGAEVVVAVRPECLSLGETGLPATSRMRPSSATGCGGSCGCRTEPPSARAARPARDRSPERPSGSASRRPMPSSFRPEEAPVRPPKPDRIFARLIRLPPFLWLGASSCCRFSSR